VELCELAASAQKSQSQQEIAWSIRTSGLRGAERDTEGLLLNSAPCITDRIEVVEGRREVAVGRSKQRWEVFYQTTHWGTVRGDARGSKRSVGRSREDASRLT
jgi:hypothetical protein